MQIITVILLAVTILPIPHDPDTVNRHEAELIAKTIWGEARGCSRAGQEAIAWCILNRVGTDGYGMGHSIEYVITFPDQFHGYDPENPVDPVDPTPDPVDPGDPAHDPGVADPDPVKPVQDKDTNAAFAKMRRKKEQLQKDYGIATKYGADFGVFSEADIVKNWGDQGITNLEKF